MENRFNSCYFFSSGAFFFAVVDWWAVFCVRFVFLVGSVGFYGFFSFFYFLNFTTKKKK